MLAIGYKASSSGTIRFTITVSFEFYNCRAPDRLIENQTTSFCGVVIHQLCARLFHLISGFQI